MKKTKALIGSICLFSMLNPAYSATPCTTSQDAGIVHLNPSNPARIKTKVYFKNCTQRVRPAFEWIYKKDNTGVFYLDHQPNHVIPVGFNSRYGADWDGTGGLVGGSQSAYEASANFDRMVSYGDTRNITSYTEIAPPDFGDLSKYPVGTYHSSMIFSVNTF